MFKFSFLTATVLIVAAVSVSAAPTDPLNIILQRAKANQDQIEDLRAEIEMTTVFSGGPPLIQKGKLLFKSLDKSKFEIDTPQRLISISNRGFLLTIDPKKGGRVKSDLSGGVKVNGYLSANEVIKNSHQYDFNLANESGETFLLEASPKAKKSFIGKIELQLNSRCLPVQCKAYRSTGALLSSASYDYRKVSDLWVQCRETTVFYAPDGNKANETEIKLENIEVNNGLPEAEFEIN